MAKHVKKFIGHFLGVMQVCAAEQHHRQSLLNPDTQVDMVLLMIARNVKLFFEQS